MLLIYHIIFVASISIMQKYSEIVLDLVPQIVLKIYLQCSRK